MGESKAAKMLQDLEYEKNDQIPEIVYKILNIKKLINYFNKIFASSTRKNC